MQERVDLLAVGDEQRVRVLGAVHLPEQARARRHEGRLHAACQEITEQDVGVDRPVVADLLGQGPRVRGELPDSRCKLRGRLLHLQAFRALGLDLALQGNRLGLEAFLLVLGDSDADPEVLDLALGLGLLLLEQCDRLALPLGLGQLVLELALYLGELVLGQRLLLGGRLVLAPEVLGGLPRGRQGRRERRPVALELGKGLGLGIEIGLNARQLLGQLVAALALVGEGVLHRGQEVLVLGRRVGGKFGDRRLARGNRLRLLPPREGDEIEEQEVDDDE